MSSTKTTKPKATAPGRKRSSAKPASSGMGAGAKAKSAPVAAPKLRAVAPTPLAAEAAAAPVIAQPDAEAATPDRAKRPDLLEAITKRSNLKRGEVKAVMDLFLDELGLMLDARDDVVLPPLGKLMVKKRVQQFGGSMLTLKLKRPGATNSEPE